MKTYKSFFLLLQLIKLVIGKKGKKQNEQLDLGQIKAFQSKDFAVSQVNTSSSVVSNKMLVPKEH